MEEIEKRYIGDGVYINIGSWQGVIVLTAENGICAQETIYLEKEQIEGIIRFAQDIGMLEKEK